MLLLTLLACKRDGHIGSFFAPPAPCTPFEEMVLSDPDGIASDNDITRVRDVVAEMADSTTVDGVCVPELRFDASGTCGEEENCYQGPGEPILIGSSSLWKVRDVMCHALAVHVGYDTDWPDPFSSGYGFRATCSEFPAALALQASTDGTCSTGADANFRQAEWALDELFSEWDMPLGEPVDITLERHEITGLVGTLSTFLAAGGAAYHALETDSAGSESMVTIDPDTFVVTARAPLPAWPDDTFRRLVPTDTTPYLVHSGAVQEAWRLQGERWTTTTFPNDAAYFYAATSGDTAWILEEPDDASEARLVAADLATGDTTTLSGPFLGTPWHLLGNADGLVGLAHVELLNDAFVLVDPTAGTYTTVPFPYDWHLASPQLAEGRVLAAWETSDLESLMVYDPVEETWHLAADPCGEARLTMGAYPAGDGWFFGSDDTGAWMTRVIIEG